MSQSEPDKTTFYRQIYQEAMAMARYAFTSGLEIPASLAADLEFLRLEPGPPPNEKPEPDQASDQPPPRWLVPKTLIRIHLGLARVVVPATPRSILHLSQQEKGSFAFLGPVPLVRQMMLLSIISLIFFVLISLSPNVDEEQINKSLLKHSGLELLLNELFLLSAAALGASFANLFEANRYCTRGSFDPKYNSSYWVRFVLGMIAGLILSELISTELGEPGANGGIALGQPMVKPILAMLGGFSSDLVVRILQRLVTGVESLIRGDARSRLADEKQLVRDHATLAMEREKVGLASDLARIKGLVAAGDQDAMAQLEEVLARLSGGN